MKQLTSSLAATTGVLVVVFVLTTNHSGQAFGAPNASNAAQPNVSVAANDLVTLERRFSSARDIPCTGELGVPTDRVFPDGTRELFVVPAGKAFVFTDLEGHITKKLSAAWPTGSIGLLTATLTGAVANQVVRAQTQITASAVSAGIAAMELHLQSGVVADSGAYVCLRAAAIYSTGVSSANVGTDVRLHGYLIDR